jgi:hypothetical protein
VTDTQRRTEGRLRSASGRIAVGRGARALAIAAGALLLAADLGGLAHAQGSPIVQLTVIRSRSAVRVGSSVTYRAFANLADGTTGVDVTETVSWSASTPGVVALTDNLATGIASGQTDVTAKDDASGVQSDPAAGTLRVVAALASVKVTPPKRVLPVKRSTRYRAIGTFEGGVEIDITADCDLSLSQPVVGTLDANGRLRAAAPGTSLVRAEDRATGVTSAASGGNAQVEVVGKLAALAVTPATLAVPVTGTTALKAKASFVDFCQQYTYTRRIAWSSSDSAVATVDREGRVSCLADGVVTISVRDRGGSVNSTGSNADARIVCGGELLAIRVSPERWTVAVGEQRELRALYVFAGGITVDGTRNVTWSTNAPSVIAIGSDGDAGSGQGLAPGEATVTAFDAARNRSSNDTGGKDGTLVVPSALASLVLSPGAGGSLTGLVGSTVKFNANASYSAGPSRAVNKLSTWSTSDPDVVGLDDGSPCYAAGTARLLAEGTSTVSATYPSSGGPFTPLTSSVVVTVVTPAPPPTPTPTPPGSASRAFLDPPAGLLE